MPRARRPGHIFAEVWRYAAANGAQPESMIGLAGAGESGGDGAGAAEPQSAPPASYSRKASARLR